MTNCVPNPLVLNTHVNQIQGAPCFARCAAPIECFSRPNSRCSLSRETDSAWELRAFQAVTDQDMRVDPEASTDQCLVFSGGTLSLEIEATNVKHNKEANLVPCRLHPRRHRAKAVYNLCDGIAINLHILKTCEATTSAQGAADLVKWSRFASVVLDLRICIRTSGTTWLQANCRVNAGHQYRQKKNKKRKQTPGCSGSDGGGEDSSDWSCAVIAGKDKEIAMLRQKIALVQAKLDALNEENRLLASENETHQQRQRLSGCLFCGGNHLGSGPNTCAPTDTEWMHGDAPANTDVETGYFFA